MALISPAGFEITRQDPSENSCAGDKSVKTTYHLWAMDDGNIVRRRLYLPRNAI
jgi:hypothetical protein